MTIAAPRIFLAAFALTAAGVLGGCATIVAPLAADFTPMGGMVVRMKAHLYGEDVESAARGQAINGKFGFEISGDRIPASAEVLPYRWAGVSAPGGWKAGQGLSAPSGRVTVLVADGIPLLKDGDLVDLYIPKNPNMSDKRWLTIARLVCKVEDKDCIKRENAKIGKPHGQQVPGATYTDAVLRISPHYDIAGNWLPGKRPSRD